MSKKSNKQADEPGSGSPASLEEALKQIDELQRRNIDLENQLSEAHTANDDQAKLIDELRSEPAQTAKPQFDLDGATYQLNVAKFRLDHNTVTASEVLANVDLQRRLVNMRVGFIKKV